MEMCCFRCRFFVFIADVCVTFNIDCFVWDFFEVNLWLTVSNVICVFGQLVYSRECCCRDGRLNAIISFLYNWFHVLDRGRSLCKRRKKMLYFVYDFRWRFNFFFEISFSFLLLKLDFFVIVQFAPFLFFRRCWSFKYWLLLETQIASTCLVRGFRFVWRIWILSRFGSTWV